MEEDSLNQGAKESQSSRKNNNEKNLEDFMSEEEDGEDSQESAHREK